MGWILKLVDVIVIFFLLLKVTVGLIFDAFFCIPQENHPKFLVDIRNEYVGQFGDYFVVEKPYFYVGFAWLELCVLWPLSLVSLFGIVYRKSWSKITCLIHGVCLSTMMVAILSEIYGSSKSSDKLKKLYWTFMGLCVLLAVRGLLPSSSHKRPVPKSRNKIA